MSDKYIRTYEVSAIQMPNLDEDKDAPMWLAKAIIKGEVSVKNNGCIYIGKGEGKQIAAPRDWILWDGETFTVISEARAQEELKLL